MTGPPQRWFCTWSGYRKWDRRWAGRHSGATASSRGHLAFSRPLLEQAADDLEQLIIFAGDADRDANRFRKAHPTEWPHDDAFVQQFVAKLLRFRANVDKNKIGMAGHGTQSELRQALGEPRSFGGVFRDRTAHVLGVLQSAEAKSRAHPGGLNARPQPVLRR